MALRTISKDELDVIVAQHAAYLRGNLNGKRADLRSADLRSADLCGADLRGADLCGADLRSADLRGADLRSADLCGADLRSADLRGADLRSADLCGADLRGADLCGADLRSADLRGADLRSADLCGADLRGADLRGADLRSADLRSAKNAELAIAKTRILPAEGEIIGWKNCRNRSLVKVRVPPESKRCHAFGRKCRAEFVDVLEIVDSSGVAADAAVSRHDPSTVYRVGERVTCHEWGADFTQECSGGIHFFITREEAADYY